MKCTKCGTDEIRFNFSEGKIFCNFCGLLIEENIANPDFSYEEKNKNKSSINGQFIRNPMESQSLYRNGFNDLVMSSAKRKINQIGNSLRLKSCLQDEALKFFVLASQRGFINGKKLQNLCVSSIYTVCRRKKTHHLLIDFSDITQIQANKIGTLFIKFKRLLNISIPVIDPSLYIERFVSRLQLGNKTQQVGMSALRLIARMKREWVSTGRRPSGLCGAAILLASKLHGIKKTEKEIGDIVRIGNLVIKSRLKEINRTSIKKLTIDEIDIGGGDDGSRNSLVENNIEKVKPPSMLRKKRKKLENEKNQNFGKKVGGKKKIRKLKKRSNKSSYKKKETLLYLNSEYETSIKENIWNEINIKYICSHSIVARAQKEKPFAFFRINESQNFSG